MDVKVGQDIVLYCKDANFYKNIDNMVKLSNIFNSTMNTVVYNNNNNSFFMNDNNGVLTVPNVVTSTDVYVLTFTNSNSNGRSKTVNVTVNGVV